MSSGLPSIPDLKPKSFWERPEGTPGMIFGVLAVIAGGWALYLALPFIIVLLQNAITAVALGVVLIIMLAIVTNKRFWTLGGYLFRSAMRRVASLYTEVDPIGIMENYVEDLRGLHQTMEKSIVELAAKMKRLQMDITQNKKDMANAISMARRAQAEGNRPALVLKSRKAGRLEESNMTLEGLYKKMELIHRVLTKMLEVCGFLIEDTDDEVKVKKREFEAVKAAETAISAASKIMRGGTTERELFDMAADQVADRVARGYAELEHFTEMSRGFIDSVDLQNGVYEESALRMIEEWEKKGDSILLGDDKSKIIAAVEDDGNVLDLDKPAPVAASARMRALLEGGSGTKSTT